MGTLIRVVVGLALPLVASCGLTDPTVCTTEARPGIQITAVDAASSAPVTDGLAGTLTEGDYTEELDVLGNTLLGAFERAGVYSVEVRAIGYETISESGIRVTAGECHVNTVSLTAEMTVAATGGP